MFSEGFLRDFFSMRREGESASPPKPNPRTITIQCFKTDPLEVRAANIVTMIGFGISDGGMFSTPMIGPADATIRALKVLRKYHELDQEAPNENR